MLTVEDVLTKFNNILSRLPGSIDNAWTIKFVGSVYHHVSLGKALSTAQSATVLKLANTHRALLIRHGIKEADLDHLRQYPQHRVPPYKSSNIPREVRYIGDNKLAFRFKFDGVVVDEIQTLRSLSRFTDEQQMPCWHPRRRIWVVSVTRSVVRNIMAFIKLHRFRFDETVVEYLCLALNSKDEPSRCDYEGATNMIRITVCDSEFTAEWVRRILRGAPA